MVEHVREFSEFGMSEDVLLRDLHFKLKEFANVSYQTQIKVFHK